MPYQPRLPAGIRNGMSPDELPDPVLEGVPASLWNKVVGPINIEHFLGTELSARSAEQYLTAQTSGAVITSTEIAPASGDGVSRGLWKMTLEPDATGGKGTCRRQHTLCVADDGFSAARPTLWVTRFQVSSLEPTAAGDRLEPGGLVSFTSSNNPPSEGVWIEYDPTFGVEGWVLRAARGGVTIQAPDLMGDFDNDLHVAGFLHEGDIVTHFFDGQITGTLAGTEIQPATTLFSVCLRLLTPAAGELTHDMTCDFVAWGS